IVAGADPEHLALLDNFCWCSSTDPARLGQLRAAARACYDIAVALGLPFISGKDSMFNDFDGFDADGRPIRISVPPTLLISSIGVVEDVTLCASLDVKMPGDLIYAIGPTRDEIGGSEYLAHAGEAARGRPYAGGTVPRVDAAAARRRYAVYARCLRRGLIAAAESVGRGGLAVALARMAIGGGLGIEIDGERIPGAEGIGRADRILFSETQGRILTSVAPENRDAFEQAMAGEVFARIGRVTEEGRLTVRARGGRTVVDAPIQKLTEAYRAPFREY
ncbi:MAG: phosphoribosylformylglycinamidine synthase, partial [Planctomycetes bacterium]|nr:phosphoribosylformylglycinamidine synthase [Planctomycetota bacterium]